MNNDAQPELLNISKDIANDSRLALSKSKRELQIQIYDKYINTQGDNIRPVTNIKSIDTRRQMSYSFGKDTRFKYKKFEKVLQERSPGPAAHHVPAHLNNHGTFMPTAKKDIPVTNQHMPGPGQYDTPQKQRRQQYTFPKGIRPNNIIPEKDKTPGPHAYPLAQEGQINLKSTNHHVKFSRARKDFDVQKYSISTFITKGL